MKKEKNKVLDLGWGNPDYLIPYWKNIDLHIPGKLDTQYMHGTLPALQKLIKDLHIKEQNAEVKDKFIVVGHGAKQVLQALFAVIGKSIWANSPYFGRFPYIAEQAGVSFNTREVEHINLITTPNNPDNRLCTHYIKNAIYDLSYNWETYTYPIKYNQDIMVFSMSKVTGHASTRIGWCILSDEKLAKKVTQYIEVNTGGVSIEAQHKAMAAISSQITTENTCFKYGKKVLSKRWSILRSIQTKFKIINEDGMFLWIYMPNMENYFKKLNIIYTKGSSCGMNDYYGRLNLGCSDKEFKELIKRIKI